MIKKLVRHGNTHAIVIDRTLMDLVGMDPEGAVTVSIDKGRIIIRPRKATVEPFDESIFDCKIGDANS